MPLVHLSKVSNCTHVIHKMYEPDTITRVFSVIIGQSKDRCYPEGFEGFLQLKAVSSTSRYLRLVTLTWRDQHPASIGTILMQSKCWRCRQRRLACDSAWPKCRQCSRAEETCHYNQNTKPLKWVPVVLPSGRNTTRSVALHTDPTDPASSCIQEETDMKTSDLHQSHEMFHKFDMFSIRFNGPELRTDVCDAMDAMHFRASSSLSISRGYRADWHQ